MHTYMQGQVSLQGANREEQQPPVDCDRAVVDCRQGSFPAAPAGLQRAPVGVLQVYGGIRKDSQKAPKRHQKGTPIGHQAC